MNEEKKYQPLTKKIKVDGKEKIVCSFSSTPGCCIHKDGSCESCRIFQVILEQLHAFEQIYLEVDNEQAIEPTM